jgi:hypothetical protein
MNADSRNILVHLLHVHHGQRKKGKKEEEERSSSSHILVHLIQLVGENEGDDDDEG